MAIRFHPMKRGTYTITSGFGPRDGGFHAGLDYGAPDGTPFYASQGGTVLYLGPADGYGQWIVIDHPYADGGGVTEYGHMWDAAATGLSVGDRVEAGQLLGYVGANGQSSGPHLHQSVMPQGYDPAAKIDPAEWLAEAAWIGETEPPAQAPEAVYGLDYAGGRPAGVDILAAGYTFVCRYLTDGGPDLPGKLLTPEEADDLRAAGVEIVSNWESWADRMLEGYSAGVQDATSALGRLARCGGPSDRPVYFSADWDVSEDEQPAIDDYLRGAASVLGADNVGIYGGYWPVKRALDADAARWAWQCQAWSGGRVDPRIHILQRNNDGYATVAGIECDINQALRPDYGQWSGTPSNGDEMTPEQAQQLDEIWQQLRGPNGAGWPQLGTDSQGRNLTLVDGLAKLLARQCNSEGGK